jgi:hypothetical protein
MTTSAEYGDVVFSVEPKLVSRRRRWRLVQSAIHLVAIGVGAVLPLLIAPAVGEELDLAGWYLLMTVAGAVLTYGWYYNRQHALSINRIAVSTRGLFPPFKPKGRRSKHDWFVSYGQISTMTPVSERGKASPAYEVVLKDGVRFQLNPLDILLYVDQSTVERYGKLLDGIRRELHENRPARDSNNMVVLPRERLVRLASS